MTPHKPALPPLEELKQLQEQATPKDIVFANEASAKISAMSDSLLAEVIRVREQLTETLERYENLQSHYAALATPMELATFRDVTERLARILQGEQ